MEDAVLRLIEQDRLDQAEKAKAQREARRASRVPESAVEVGQRATRTVKTLATTRAIEDPTGFGEALTALRQAVRDAEDAAVALMRASGEYSWAEVAQAVGMDRRSVIRRWGPSAAGTDEA